MLRLGMRWTLLALVFLVGCISTPKREPALWGFGKEQRELNFEEFQRILIAGNFSRIQDVLKFLYEDGSYIEYMGHHTFGFDSLSIQGSSYSHPRAIVYGKTAKFIITFNGDPSQDGYDKIETMEFNEQTETFDFREIKFLNDERLKKGLAQETYAKGFKVSPVGGPRKLDHYLEDGELRPEEVTFEKGRCLQCHTNNRPIWTAYPKWPGFYGGQDDVFYFLLGSKLEPKLKEENVGKKMRDHFAAFNKSIKGSRYFYLGKNLNQPGFQYQSPRPNGFLTERLFALNGRRVERILKDFGPARLNSNQCRELKERDFMPAALQMAKANFYRDRELFDQTAKETFEPEGAENQMKYRREYHYYRKVEDHLNEGKVFESIYVDYAHLHYFFPQIHAETFGTDVYESIYNFGTGGGLREPNAGRAMADFINSATFVCRKQN